MAKDIEEIDRIKELEKRLEALETRITKLEGNPATQKVANNGKDYQKEKFKIALQSFVRDDDGQITKFWKSAKKVNYDVRSSDCYANLVLSAEGKVANTEKIATNIYDTQYNKKSFLLLTEIADEKGHKFSFNIPDPLPEKGLDQHELLRNMKNELVRIFGKGGTAFFNDYMLTIDSGFIYPVGADVMNDVVTYLSDQAIIKREWDNEPFVDNFDWTDAERYEAIKRYVRSLKKRFA